MIEQWSDWLESRQQRIAVALDQALPPLHENPKRLHEAMAYAIQAGGKRIRPLLLIATSELVQESDPALQVAVDQACAAIEMIHTYSLVHDDLPCMDDDDLRRGKPTTHKAFDEATAMLVGDALQTRAFELLTQLPVSSEIRVELVAELAKASGSMGMAGGQAIDLESVGHRLTQTDLERMHRLKTGALLRASVRMGAILAGLKEERASLDLFAKSLGLGFQVIDDILDATQDSATLGKTAGKDAKDDKPTFVSLLGLEGAKRFASQLEAEAMSALVVFGSRADPLINIAQWVNSRNH